MPRRNKKGLSKKSKKYLGFSEQELKRLRKLYVKKENDGEKCKEKAKK